MNYIRTKDTVLKVATENEKRVIGTSPSHLEGVFVLKNDIIDQADNIKKLCDGFYVQIDDWHFDSTHLFDNLEKAIEDFDDWQSYSDRKGLEYEIEVYAFIKTSKGLIYVAKMNDKGELELI